MSRQDEGDYSFPGEEGASQGQDVVHPLFEDDTDQPSDVSEMTPVAPEKPRNRFHLGHVVGGLFLAVFGGWLFYGKVIAPRANAQAVSEAPAMTAPDPRSFGAELAPPSPPSAFPQLAASQPEGDPQRVQAGMESMPMPSMGAGSATAVEPTPRESIPMAASPASNQAMQELQVRLIEMEARNTRLEQRMVEIEEQLRHKEVAAVKRPAVQAKAPTPARRAAAERTLADYKVRVARTGQAWLDHAGQTMVVQVGDSLPNGARVSGIDPATGRVATTLGVVHP